MKHGEQGNQLIPGFPLATEREQPMSTTIDIVLNGLNALGICALGAAFWYQRKINAMLHERLLKLEQR